MPFTKVGYSCRLRPKKRGPLFENDRFLTTGAGAFRMRRLHFPKRKRGVPNEPARLFFPDDRH
jgi:hypothetical protein